MPPIDAGSEINWHIHRYYYELENNIEPQMVNKSGRVDFDSVCNKFVTKQFFFYLIIKQLLNKLDG